MKSYNVNITDRAEKMMEKYLAHLVYEKQNMQAAIAVSDDYDETIDELETIAGSLRFCDDVDLRNREIRRIKFRKHDYILLYRVEVDDLLANGLGTAAGVALTAPVLWFDKISKQGIGDR